MRFLTGTYLIFSLLIIFSSCSYKQNQILFERRNRVPDSILQRANDTGSYRIEPQDVLQIRNLQSISSISGDASGSSGGGGVSSGQTFQVEENGNVALPALGYVHVAGLTRAEAEVRITDLYRTNLLKNPIIELKIINLKITMLGEIKSQGNFPLVKDKTTLIEMIGEAGGLTEKANEKNIEIIRKSQSNAVVIKVDLSNIKSLADPATILQNGDIVYITQNKRAARADNLQNFSVLFQPALILFNTALIIYTLAHH